jgi:hypothetical protein
MTGDQADFLGRLRAVLPRRWFPDTTPVLDALLNGWASAWAGLYLLLQFMRAQARIATASGVWLDFIATDYFGRTIYRFVAETDTQFSARIRRELLRPRATRAALISALTDLTGRVPLVFEPRRATDTGGYGSLGMTMGTGLGYGVAGGYGSLLLPFQVFVRAYRLSGGGVANVGGYYAGTGWAGGGYGVGALEYVSADMIAGQVTDAAIYDATARTMPAATIAWTNISS